HAAVVAEVLKTAEAPSGPASNPTSAETWQGEATVEPSSPQPPREPCPTTTGVAPGMPEQFEPASPQPPREPAPESPRLQARRAKRQRRVERFERVHQRHRQGHSDRRIARELGLSRSAVRRYLRCGTCPDWSP